ncbi:TPA: 16S rRNA (cytosine(1402)-N(4))-methyltransferase RsmH [Candidatus Bipolaricaulota bacterium]|nr:16S rRNA (cytosine(1402)-N(4))-methyltransferase RsmH [Candidatus Bipolaricaulota bacterium]HIP99014.1 16S rRNA (cytosine(1402)-N(4))-methyltransferase RsmH [Candidatus Bipolaricaulota bacterium]
MSKTGSPKWHEPVLVREVVELLSPAPGKLICDATCGTGGHAEAILARGAELVGLDKDPQALALARERLAKFGPRARLLHADFRELREALAPLGITEVHGILFDLGLSSLQLDSPARGFSFREDAPLDMRMDPCQDLTAAELVNRLPEPELARILWEYGEERYARRIARAIVRARDKAPIRTTGELAHLVARCYPPGKHRIHPATRTFQALRIAVNDELTALREGLAQAVPLLAPGGVVCVISFHSLEDRIVKHLFRARAATGRLELLTKKPLRPSAEEVASNPRARSAKLRAARVPEVASA